MIFIYSVLFFLSLAPLLFGFRYSGNILGQIFISGLVVVTFILGIGFYNTGDFFSGYFFYVLISNLLVFATAYLSRGQKIENKNSRAGESAGRKSVQLAILLGLTACSILLMGIGGVEKATSIWTDVAEDLSQNTGYRILATILFIYSTAYIILARYNGVGYLGLSPAVFILIVFALLIRVKLYIAPVLLGVLIPASGQRFKYSHAVFGGLVFFSGYLIVMLARWLGGLGDITSESFFEVAGNVLDAGVERELFGQFSSVMNHFNGSNLNYGAAYIRIVLSPIDLVFSTNLSPSNPMYEYYQIHTGVSGTGGSAHPTIYADSFAGFSVLGVVVPSLFYILFLRFGKKSAANVSSAILYAAALFSMPLIVRGSVYYGVLYFLLGYFASRIVFFISVNKKLYLGKL